MQYRNSPKKIHWICNYVIALPRLFWTKNKAIHKHWNFDCNFAFLTSQKMYIIESHCNRCTEIMHWNCQNVLSVQYAKWKIISRLEPTFWHLCIFEICENILMMILHRIRFRKKKWKIHFTLWFNLQIINGKYVEGFYIYARQLDSDNDTYKMLTVLNGGGASTCTVTGLMKYQSYEFFIVPFYKTVEGKPSNSRMARTLEDGKFNQSVFVAFIYFFLACILHMEIESFHSAKSIEKTTFSGFNFFFRSVRRVKIVIVCHVV